MHYWAFKPIIGTTQVKDSDLHGKGLFAAANIQKNTIIGTLEGKNVNTDGLHVLWMNDGQDKFKVENDLKYINHSKQANVAYYDDRGRNCFITMATIGNNDSS